MPQDSKPEDRVNLEKNIWRLGNLTLLERVSNSAASNKTVKQKFDEETFKNSKIVLSRLLQVKNFSGDAAVGKNPKSKHNSVLKKYKIETLKLTDEKYFGFKQIEDREKYMFSILSGFFGVELKTINL